jgi:hypothetical protein
MNTIENKGFLWDLLVENKGFKDGVSIQTAQTMFESLLRDIDSSEEPLIEKNKFFLKQYTEQMNSIEISPEELIKYRESLFEERVRQNQERYKIPPAQKDLTEVKQLLYRIIELLDN